MKACAIAASILILLTFLSILNGMYIKDVLGSMLKLEESFPDKNGDGESSPDPYIERAKELWDNSYDKITLTCHTGLPNNVTLALEHMISCYLHGSRADYLSARVAYVEALKAFSRSEKLGIGSII